MAMAAATGRIIEMPIRSLEKVSDVGRRKIQFPPLPLRIDEKSSSRLLFTSLHLLLPTQKSTPFRVVSCLPSPKTPFNPSTKLFVSGLFFLPLFSSIWSSIRYLNAELWYSISFFFFCLTREAGIWQFIGKVEIFDVFFFI